MRPFIAPPFRSLLLFAETVVANNASGPDSGKFYKGGESSYVLTNVAYAADSVSNVGVVMGCSGN